MSVTLNCRVAFEQYIDDSAIYFAYEDIPIVLDFRGLADVVDKDSMKSVNLHVNDDRTICKLYDLYDYWMRDGQFDLEMTREVGQYREDTSELSERIKAELNNADLKLTAPPDIIRTIINEAGRINMHELHTKYPEDYHEYTHNYEAASSSGTNEVFNICEKSRQMFPAMMRGRGGGKNGRRSRRSRRLIRSRRKAKRVKRTKSMKRYNQRR